MALLEMGGKRFTIPPGDVSVGSDASCAIQLGGTGVLPKHAIIRGAPDGQVVVRKAVAEAEVTINGVRLGAEPTPLLHGDKVEVAGHELTFVDERRSGSTQYISAMKVPEVKAATTPGKATGNTGGRVVCLTDGREYTITGASLVFGREAGCDVVVPGKDVSRRHAEIVQTPKGYLLVDSSTNGTFVNEERVEGQRLLARGDVLKLGEEQFRFYADPPKPPGPPEGPAAKAPAAAPPKLADTAHGMPAAPRPVDAGRPSQGGGGPPLASFLVKNGSLKGQRLPVRMPIVNIGRADYNDLVVPDESVSTQHAKLQRREGVWVLVDLGSTNGTFADGERVSGDAPLAPGAMVRFGDVQLVFETTEADDQLGVAKGGGTKVMRGMAPSAAPPPPSPRASAPAPKPAAPAPAPPRPPAPKRPIPPPVAEKKGKGCGGSAAVFILSVTALAYWLLA
jgi:pSer/pThr/pTyr-binding forkhead associated (FHA) protein